MNPPRTALNLLKIHSILRGGAMAAIMRGRCQNSYINVRSGRIFRGHGHATLVLPQEQVPSPSTGQETIYNTLPVSF